MSYIAPLDRTTGTLISASIWNINVDDIVAIYGGAMGIASQAANDFLYAASATQLARLAAGAGPAVPYWNGTAWAMLSGMAPLHAASGTDTSAGATNVDTYALGSQLSAKDRLLVVTDLSEITQNAAGARLYTVTDAATIMQLSGAALLSAGQYATDITLLAQDQSAATAVTAFNLNGQRNDTTQVTPNTPVQYKNTTFATAWTGNWTLALRHDGVTAGGTFRWSWSIYVLRGQ